MAKVKNAKQKITDFLKAKGLDASEIKDAFDELEAADASLDTLATQLQDVTAKNTQWNKFYTESVIPDYTATATERDRLKSRLDQLEKAGIKLEEMKEAVLPNGSTVTPSGEYITPQQFADMQNRMAQAMSTVVKDLNRVSLRHFNKYKEEADLDAIEEIVASRNLSVADAYEIWVRPKEEERSGKERQEAIDRGIKEGIQNRLSEMGVTAKRSRRIDPDVEPAPLDKPAPTRNELKESFMKDWNSLTEN